VIRTLTAAVVLALTAATASATGVPGPDEIRGWPQFGRDAAHTGFNPRETLITPDNVATLARAWHRPYGAIRFSDAGPVVADGRVFAGSANGTIMAFDAHPCGTPNCEPLWVEHSRFSIDVTPAYARGRLYVGSASTLLRVLDATNGDLLWQAKTGREARPTVAGDRLYAGSTWGLSAFDARGRGREVRRPLWVSGRVGQFSAVAVSGGFAYASMIGDTGGELQVYDADGCGATLCQPVWRGTTGGGVLASPAVSGGVVFVGGLDNRLHAFDADGCGSDTCTPLWSAPLRRGFTPGATEVSVANGTVYVGGFDGRLYAFAEQGCGQAVCRPLWTWFAGEGQVVARQPLVAGGVVFVDLGRDFVDAEVLAFDAAGCGQSECEPLARWLLPNAVSELAEANGLLYVSGTGLIALGLPG
jgi:outer membrane protein assembly factor BamB